MHYLKWMSRILSAAIVIVLIGSLSITAKASNKDDIFNEPVLMRATVYTASEGNITADGSKVREGIIAGKREWLGYTALIYSVDEDGSIGEFIGYYEVKDTGGHEGLKDGSRIDVYRDSLERCNEWISTYGDYVYIKLIWAVG